MDEINKRRLMGLLMVVAGVLVLIGIIYMYFFYSPKPAEQDKTGESQVIDGSVPKGKGLKVDIPDNVSQKTVVEINTPLPPKSEVNKEDLKRMAASFAERYGSFSNQSNFGNIRDLKIFMSSNMQAWADDYIKAEIDKKTDSSIYYGATTRAVSQEVLSYDESDGSAEILVHTQREEATGTTNNISQFQQDIKLMFIKERKAWKVNGAYWQEKKN
jgi:hypothetical protein